MGSFRRVQMKRVIQGVIPILPAPFLDGGEIDMSSFLRAIDTAIRHKATGVVMFGLASEYYKLSDAERFRCISALVHQVAKRIPAIISIVAHSTEVAVKDAKFAEQEGADAIMVLPPFFLAPNADSVRRHILEVASGVSLPVIIQYAPAQTGYPIAADSFAQLRQDAPNITCIKVDQVPAGPMVQELQRLGMDSVVGYMGINLPHDYECGAIGVMPTVSLCPAFVEIWKLLVGKDPGALVLHETFVPLLKFMMKSIECLIASEKQLLEGRGVIRSKYCRRPSYTLDLTEQAELAEYASRVAPWLVEGNEGI
jgi:dihydrodipicolinate synthase/N-acetylneuraminate lyase